MNRNRKLRGDDRAHLGYGSKPTALPPADARDPEQRSLRKIGGKVRAIQIQKKKKKKKSELDRLARERARNSFHAKPSIN
jgi:hypothetical protein